MPALLTEQTPTRLSFLFAEVHDGAIGAEATASITTEFVTGIAQCSGGREEIGTRSHFKSLLILAVLIPVNLLEEHPRRR
jgi:hypothetical protein